jgi:hydroxymethylbilane synthase
MTATLDRTRPLTIASRGSALAMAQTTNIGHRLEVALGIPVSVLEVVSHGDIDPRALTQIGGTGVFVSALRSALRAGSADVAVHSFKDLPVAAEPDLVIAAVPPREDPADVLVSLGSVSLAELPPGARVGTGSPRRAAQLHALRPDLEIVEVRGNVDTRIAKVRSGDLDAVVLARAGLARLGRLADVADTFTPREMVPAPGQGALAIECRADDVELTELLRAALDDAPTRVCVEAERAVLAHLEVGCSAPIGALAEIDGTSVVLTAVVGENLRHSASGDPASGRELGIRVASELLRQGAGRLMATTGTDGHHPGRTSTGHFTETD